VAAGPDVGDNLSAAGELDTGARGGGSESVIAGPAQLQPESRIIAPTADAMRAFMRTPETSHVGPLRVLRTCDAAQPGAVPIRATIERLAAEEDAVTLDSDGLCSRTAPFKMLAALSRVWGEDARSWDREPVNQDRVAAKGAHDWNRGWRRRRSKVLGAIRRKGCLPVERQGDLPLEGGTRGPP
jgi:hypothetical protein